MIFLLISIVGAFLNAAQIKHYEIQGWDARVVITANSVSYTHLTLPTKVSV